MNAYFIHSGVWHDFSGSGSLVCDVVFAPTRGRAKSLFYKKYKEYINDYTSIKMCRLLAKNVNRKEGCSDGEEHDTAFWEMIPMEWEFRDRRTGEKHSI